MDCDWIRGRSLGCGSFATVNLAIPSNVSAPLSSLFAVKSSNLYTSSLLKNEEHVLNRLGSSCPRIIKCFGHDSTFENGDAFYNLFLEYASRGTLSDQLKNQGGRFPEPQVRRFTRSIIEGLKHVHENGFVHCDIKLQNILVFDDGDVKIADFGLAKEKGEKQGKKRWECRGTPLFMSPESVNDNEYESPADIWALGCAVVEMATGKPVWRVGSGPNMWSLLIRIGVGEELPMIPEELSEQGKDFLRRCFVRDPTKRWTAEMLLNHPFVSGGDDDVVSVKEVSNKVVVASPSASPSPSPRTNFDFPDWASTVTASSTSTVSLCLPSLYSPVDRLRRLATDQGPPDWSELDGWTSVR